jgi:hypothetical protein
VASLAKFVAGGAIGLGLHEGGHVVVDLGLGSGPGLRQVNLGWVPFFAITHDHLSPAGEFATSSAGFWMQHLSSEVMLSRHPGLRLEHAPMLKGLLAFNVLASAAYSAAAFVRGGPAERDTRGMAVSADIPEPWVGVTVLVPAVLDAARYYRPETAWLKWVSRATKVGGALLIVKAIGRNSDL